MDDSKLRIAALQGVLQSVNAYKGRVDGIVGPMTRKAIVADPEVAQKGADVIGGDVLADLVASASAGDRDVIEKIKLAASEFNEDAVRFIAKAKIESNFDPNAVRGIFKGLFQMGPPAWEDASDIVDSMGLPPLGKYSENWSDALQNSRAAIAYQLALEAQVKSLGWRAPLSEAERYLAHQQGAYGLVRIKKAASGQTLRPNDASAMLKAMRSNVPQDGLGVTVDPREFLARWDSVFAERYANAVA